VIRYWHIGREIVEFVQSGASRAEYGEQVLEGLSTSRRVGRGYSLRNLGNFRSFYQKFADREPVVPDAQDEFGSRHLPNIPAGRALQIRQTSSAEFVAPSGFSNRLAWSHYLVLSKVTDLAARSFYELEAASENWPVEHLERQIHTQLHLRLLKSRLPKAGGAA
jgi:hypothetical protein